MLGILNRLTGHVLLVAAVGLLVVLTVIVVIAVFSRFFGASLAWYDEVCNYLLAWLTFYGCAFVALRRGHMGFGGLVSAMPLGWRAALFVAGEIITCTLFVLLAWAGYHLQGVYGDEPLATLPWVTEAVAHSALPIGAALFVIAELCSIPKAWQRVVGATDLEKEEMEEAIRAGQEAAARLREEEGK